MDPDAPAALPAVEGVAELRDEWCAVVMAAGVVLSGAARGGEDDPVYSGGEIHVSDEQLRPVEIFTDTAVETEVVTAEEVRDLPVTNAADAIENLPGIRVQQRLQGEEGAVSIEGMPVTYTEILVNGQRYSGEVGGVDDLRDIPIANVERIEILRGGQGVRYGTDAGGGVINVVTKSAPAEGVALSFDGGGGTQGKWYGALVPAARIGKLGVTLTGAYDQIDGYDPRGDQVNTQAGGEDSRRLSRDVYATLEYELTPAIRLRGQGGWRREEEHSVPTDEFAELFQDDESSSRDITRWTGTVGLDAELGEATRSGATFTYYYRDTHSTIGRPFTLKEDELKFDASADHYLETGPIGHLLIAGLDVTYPRLDLAESGSADFDGTALEGESETRRSYVQSSLFLQTESALTDWFSLILGARGRFNTDFPARVLPQVGLLVKPLPGLKLRASWGMNYRTPTLRELYQPPVAQLEGAYFLTGNPELEPEESMTYRAGLEWSPADWLSLSGTGFYNDIQDNIRSLAGDDLDLGDREVTIRLSDDPERLAGYQSICDAQVLSGAPLTPDCTLFLSSDPDDIEITVTMPDTRTQYVKQNLDSVQTWGAETRVRLRWSRWVHLMLGYTYLQTRVDDSNLVDLDELPNEPAHVVDARLVLTAPVTNTHLGANARWRSSAIVEGSGTGLLGFANSSERFDPSLVLDLRLSQPVLDWLEIYFDVGNVTNTESVDSYAIRGRSYFAGVKGTFHANPWGGSH